VGTGGQGWAVGLAALIAANYVASGIEAYPHARLLHPALNYLTGLKIRSTVGNPINTAGGGAADLG
jgi:hypothetical protein